MIREALRWLILLALLVALILLVNIAADLGGWLRFQVGLLVALIGGGWLRAEILREP